MSLGWLPDFSGCTGFAWVWNQTTQFSRPTEQVLYIFDSRMEILPHHFTTTFKPSLNHFWEILYRKWRVKWNFCKATRSPPLAMLKNSGLQILFLEICKTLKNSKNVSNCFTLATVCEFSFHREKTADYTRHRVVILDFGIWKTRLHEWVDREKYSGHSYSIKSGKTVLKNQTWTAGFHAAWFTHSSAATAALTFQPEQEPFILLRTGNLGY